MGLFGPDTSALVALLAQTLQPNIPTQVAPMPPPQIPTQYEGLVDRYSNQYGIPKSLMTAMLHQESKFNPNAVSQSGARGLAQFMPATAKQYGVDTSDPESSIRGMAQYMSDLNKQFGGDWKSAIAAYNAGPGRVRQAGGVPNIPETQNYVNNVMGLAGLNGPTMNGYAFNQDDVFALQYLLGDLI